MKLGNKVLITFSDPGGAKPCLALASTHGISELKVVSDRDYPFYKDFGISVSSFNGNVSSYFEDFRPDGLFTGTSYTSDIEQKFIAEARSRNIACWSFVDHWTDVSKRFINKRGELVLPDYVWVIDQQAKDIAVSEGINSDRIYISGNPYHQWLKKWKPKISRHDFLLDCGVDNIKKIILFAPDPLSNVDGLNTYGFDEISALKTLTELLKEHSLFEKEFVILVKPHPNQDLSKMRDVLDGCDFIKLLSVNTDTNHSLYFADTVIGFFSSVLIEAEILGKPVIRYLEDEFVDPFAGMKIGKKVGRNELLTEILKSYKAV